MADSACNLLINMCCNNSNNKRKADLASSRRSSRPTSLCRQQAAPLQRLCQHCHYDHCHFLHDRISCTRSYGIRSRANSTQIAGLQSSHADRQHRVRLHRNARKHRRHIGRPCPVGIIDLFSQLIGVASAHQQLTAQLHALVRTYNWPLELIFPTSVHTIPQLIPHDPDLLNGINGADNIHGVACNDCGRCFDTADSLHQHQWDTPDHTRVSKPSCIIPNLHACSQCGGEFRSASDLEEHYVQQHPITEVCKSDEEGKWEHLAERFRAAWKNPDMELHSVDRIFKVYNPGWRRRQFEEYRKELKRGIASVNQRRKAHHIDRSWGTSRGCSLHDGTDVQASRSMEAADAELCKRVLHNGNELKQHYYHGTSIKCFLGQYDGSQSKAMSSSSIAVAKLQQQQSTTIRSIDPTSKQVALCKLPDCMCRILQEGFKKSKCKTGKFQRFGKGIYCSPVSSKASGYVKCSSTNLPVIAAGINSSINGGGGGDYTSYCKAMLACKVLAGRPFHSAVNRTDLTMPPPGFHSVHGDKGAHLNYEELVLYDDRAILPDYLILYSSTDKKW